ncbi:hypothetical protein CK203_064979 [Vitis vinifera]|uniref:Uncharacterized protein n=1 Tax=Vitis vinifera TaxID=29760 RepID=A0A438G2U4_VITVI|nr:hypothetical protein CK203_064979 [Vitis vinifera]
MIKLSYCGKRFAYVGMMKCKVERIVVEKKSFQVEFEELKWRNLVISNRKEPRFCSFSRIWYGELDWLTEHLKKAVGVGGFQGFIRKIRGKTKTLLMEICFITEGGS